VTEAHEANTFVPVCCGWSAMLSLLHAHALEAVGKSDAAHDEHVRAQRLLRQWGLGRTVVIDTSSGMVYTRLRVGVHEITESLPT